GQEDARGAGRGGRRPRRQLGGVGEQREKRGGGPVEDRWLARELSLGPGRHEPFPGADHLARHERLARLSPGIERHAAEPGEEEEEARGDEQERRSHGPGVASPRSLSLGVAAVSVARSWPSPSPGATMRAGAIARSMPSATSGAATGVPGGG